MRVIDLMDKAALAAAYKTGKRLAKAMGIAGLTPRTTFGKFLESHETLNEIESRDELRILEVALHQLFDWDVAISAHFVERALGRDASVPMSAILDVFKKLKTKYAVQIARATQMGKTVGSVDIVVQDYDYNLNIVVALDKKATLKTMMAVNPDEFTLRSGAGRELKFKV